MKLNLTEKQKWLMGVVRDEWINRFLDCSKEPNRELIEKKVQELYVWSGKKKPKVIICESPLGCHLKYTEINGAKTKTELETYIKKSINHYCFDDMWHQSYWVPFYDYFQRIGVSLGPKEKDFNRYKEIVLSEFVYGMFYESVAIVSVKPLEINRDENGRLHKIDGPAIKWRDGWENYAVHGVRFKKDLFTEAFIKKSLKPEDILTLDNAEQKSVIIQEYGYGEIIKSLGDKVKIINKEKGFVNRTMPVEYVLMDVDFGWTVHRFVKVGWYHKDKSYHETFLGVPISKETDTCKKAIAWTFYMKEDEYKPELET